jgi:hypothetical protein
MSGTRKKKKAYSSLCAVTACRHLLISVRPSLLNVSEIWRIAGELKSLLGQCNPRLRIFRPNMRYGL